MTIEQMRERKRELGYSYQKIAELSGLPVGTVQKVLGGITRSPREETIWALEAVLKPIPPTEEKFGSDETGYDLSRGSGVDHIGELPGSYGSRVRRQKKQGEYTVADYYALPDDVRVELIDGVFYDMATPAVIHQVVAFEITMQISSFIKSREGKCVPMMAPLDVQLGCDDKTVVQPDLLVVCDRNKIHKQQIQGAPDLVVEILSAATRRKDMSVKLSKYSESGVREYWLVDPDKKRVLVYPLEQEDLPMIYGFRDQVPVGIFGAAFRVDFAKIDDYLSEL